MRVLRSATTFAICIIAADCRSSAAPEAPLIFATIAVTPGVVYAGDTAHVSITVTNRSAGTITVLAPGCNNDFDIRGADGTVYHTAEDVVCQFLSVGPEPLGAGASLVYVGFTTGRVIPEGSQDPPILLPEGDYQVRCAVVQLIGDEDSNPIDFTPAALHINARPSLSEVAARPRRPEALSVASTTPRTPQRSTR